jgi:predicted dehydrogenase
MPELQAAVIGAGFVGRAHIEALRRLGIPITGVLGSSPARGKETAQSLGLARAYDSLDDLARDSAVDAVHVCTPNHLHYEQVSTLLRADKHVMCEKPLAMDAKESAELVKLARAQKRAGAVAYNLRYYPLCQEARAMIARGDIGEPRMVHGGFLQDWLFYPTDWNWRLEPHLGGQLRAVSDIGTHWLDLATWLTGRRVKELCADLATMIPVRQRPRGRSETFKTTAGESDPVQMSTDDYASVLLQFEGSLRGVMTVSQVSAGRKALLECEISGSEGSLAFNSESPNELWLGRRSEANRILLKDPALMSPESRGYANYPGGHTEGYADTFFNLFRDFYGYIRAGDMSRAPTFPTFETGHQEMVLCDAIAESARTRQWVHTE